MQASFRYSLLELPDDGYMPRLADDRVGYFPNLYLNYSKDTSDTPYVRYINRWRLEKKDPSADLSDPVKPIVFWLENSIPERYRPAIEKGVLLWNEAFEDLSGSAWRTSRLDYPFHDVVAAVQSLPLGVLLDPTRLSRLIDLEKMTDDALSLDEFFEILRTRIWSELKSSTTIDSHRRTLQERHLDHLIALAIQGDAPGDAISLARLELTTLRSQLGPASSRMKDRTSKAHIERMRAKVAAALDAKADYADGALGWGD